MKYLLLKNGQIATQNKLIHGDILIGNNRIMEIARSIRIPSPDAMVIDVGEKFLLPGLLHYNCPFLKTEESEQLSSTIYMALSHGSTFLMDTIRVKKEGNFRDAIEQAREGCKPIVTDYGFHLGASACTKVSLRDLNYGFIHEGITSYYVKWKHIEKIKDGQLDHLLTLAARLKLLIVCETNSIKQSLIANRPEFIKTYFDKLRNLLAIVNSTGCPFLFTDIAMEQELEVLFPEPNSNLPVFASVNLNCSNELVPGRLGIPHLTTLHENPNISLAPPNLIGSEPDFNVYIEHGKSPSFLLNIFSTQKNINPLTLNMVCEMYATRPARLFGLYPQKGTLEPGADADIIIWNPIEPDRSKTSGSNTSLLRKDISALIINGNVITDDQLTAPSRLCGRFIQRSSVIQINPIVAQKS